MVRDAQVQIPDISGTADGDSCSSLQVVLSVTITLGLLSSRNPKQIETAAMKHRETDGTNCRTSLL